MKARESFVFYKSWHEAIKPLNDDLRLEVYDALTQYGLYGEVGEVSPMAKVALNFIVPTMERDAERYEEICNRRKESGKKGGEARASNYKQMQANADNCKQVQHDNDNDNEIKKYDDYLKKKEIKNKEKNFLIFPKENPVSSEVLHNLKTAVFFEFQKYYFDDRMAVARAVAFVDYYRKQNWRTNEGKPITNVKSLIKKWAGMNAEKTEWVARMREEIERKKEKEKEEKRERVWQE